MHHHCTSIMEQAQGEIVFSALKTNQHFCLTGSFSISPSDSILGSQMAK